MRVLFMIALTVATAATPALAKGHRGHVTRASQGGGGHGHRATGIGGKGIATAASPRGGGGSRAKPSWDLMTDFGKSGHSQRTATRAAPGIPPVHINWGSAPHRRVRHYA
jgi:hypothetical protein